MVATTGEEEFIVQLDETSEEEHLDLADSRNGVPGLDTLGRDGGKRGAVRKLSGETEAGANGPPADEGGHGNASVLDLGVTEPGNGLIRSKFGEAEGIPNRSELDAIRRSEGSFTGLAWGGDRGGGFRGSHLLCGLLGGLLGNCLLCHVKRGGGKSRLLDRDERLRDAKDGSESDGGELHVDRLVVELGIEYRSGQPGIVESLLRGAGRKSKRSETPAVHFLVWNNTSWRQT